MSKRNNSTNVFICALIYVQHCRENPCGSKVMFRDSCSNISRITWLPPSSGTHHCASTVMLTPISHPVLFVIFYFFLFQFITIVVCLAFTLYHLLLNSCLCVTLTSTLVCSFIILVLIVNMLVSGSCRSVLFFFFLLLILVTHKNKPALLICPIKRCAVVGAAHNSTLTRLHVSIKFSIFTATTTP